MSTHQANIPYAGRLSLAQQKKKYSNSTWIGKVGSKAKMEYRISPIRHKNSERTNQKWQNSTGLRAAVNFSYDILSPLQQVSRNSSAFLVSPVEVFIQEGTTEAAQGCTKCEDSRVRTLFSF